MWHVSISKTRKRPHQPPERLHQPARLEQRAIEELAGVGGDVEWWIWSPARVGHLRVATTPEEAEQIPPWDGPIDDAGESGRQRRRTR